MQAAIVDTIPVQIADTIQDSIVKADYFIGNIIPVDTSGKSFPDTLVTSDGVFAGVCLHYQRADGELMAEKPFNSDFGFGVLTFSLVMLAFLVILGRKMIINTISSLSIKRVPAPQTKSAIGVLSWAPVLTNLFSFLNVSLFIVLGGVTTGMTGDLPGYETIKICGIVLGALSAAALLRHLICKITGAVSGQKEVFREYLSVIYAIWFLLGVTFFILSFLILFTGIEQPEIIVWVGAGLFGLLYFYRIIRLLIIFLKRHVLIYYFILYLCALEVLPVLIIIKLLKTF